MIAQQPSLQVLKGPLPLTIPGLAVWLASDYGLFWERTGASATTPAFDDGDPVGTWAFRKNTSAGNGYATATSNSKRPALKVAIQNGRNVVRFDGVDDFLRTTFTLNQPHTRLAVLLNRSVQNANHIMIDGANDEGAYMYFSAADTPRIYAGGGSGVNGSAVGAAWNIWRGTYDGAASKISINGGSVTTGTIGANNAAGITIGSGGGGTNWFTDCDIGEILAFDTALSDISVAVLLAYLNARWGVF